MNFKISTDHNSVGPLKHELLILSNIKIPY